MAMKTLQSLFGVLLVLLHPHITYAQCVNNLAVYNPNLRTVCTNETFFIVPVPSATVKQAVAPYNLVPLPTNDVSLFPNGFPAGAHPVVVSSGLESDIRMSDLQIANLLTGAITVPYVDRLGDGKTPFVFSVKQYIGGYNGQSTAGYVPALVGSIEGTNILVATFVPNNAAYASTGSSGDEFISQIKEVIVPNPVSGPGVIPEAADTDFFTEATSTFTSHTFHEFISQPLILTNGDCQRNPIYFNQTFSDPAFRNGTVILYSPGGAFPGVYDNVQGYSASGEQVGYNPEACNVAAANTDPNSLA